MKTQIFKKTLILFFSFICLFGCNFFNSFSEDEEDNNQILITSLTMAKSSLNVSVGEMTYVTVSVKPQNIQKDVKLLWNYDESVITADTSSAFGVTITGKTEGQTNLKCSYGGYEATCIVTVKGFAENYEETIEPYIYSNTSIIQTSPGVTEKVYCSLYGGSAADIDGYSWSCDNMSVASIEPTGQYCLITARDSGYARIKITHNKAAYPYYMGIYVFADATNVSYITTADNILTMNLADAEKNISVSLVNGSKNDSDDQFNWEIINEDENTPVKIEINGNKAVVKPIKSGSCTVRVTHPESAYPLDILCRVISVIKNVYIQPDKTVLTLSGETEQTVSSTLKNIDIGEYNVDAFTYTLDDYNVAEIVGWVGNEVMLKGKANGSCKLLISHEKAAYTREVLLIINGQLKDAIDSSCYITTSQNYIRTKVGDEGTYLNISLKGGEEGDEAGFIWSIKSVAADGSSSDVISMDTSNGTVINSNSRAAMSTYSYGKAYIEPKYEGIAVISITHPKVIYPTEILVKVLNKDAILEQSMYFTGSGLMRILNGQNQDYTVQLKGDSKTDADDQNIKWSCNNSSISLAPSGNTVNVTAPSYGSGCTTSQMTATHNKVDNDKSVLILTADDEETLKSMKALYSDKLYYNLNIEESATVILNQVGFNTYDEDTDTKTEYDFSPLKWTVKDPSIVSIEKNNLNPLICKIKALKSGQTTLTASIESYSCDFKILVYPEGVVATEPEVYFTTSQNVVTLGGEGNSAKVYVSAVNLTASEYSKIAWTIEDESVCSAIPNGTNATITAKKEGETVIKVNHPDSQNELKIYVRVGSEYVIPEAEPVIYISSNDVMTFLRDDPAQSLQAVLVNYNEADSDGFYFSIDNENVAKITAQSSIGTAYIKPVSSGQAEITISHDKTTLTKKVLVVVGNTAEELAGFTYLTTGSNVVAVGEGQTKTVSVSIKNSEKIVLDGYNWISSDPSIVDVIQNGATAVLTGNSIGTAMITVTNKNCTYPLQIIAQCVDPIAAAANPYIQLTSSVITVNISSTYTNVTADLVGGCEDDYRNFIWQSSDTSVCICYGQNEVGKIRALKEGTAYITVSHPKSTYTAQILVVCDKTVQSDCYISVPSSIINMKPTDSAQTITASLINGVETDKYNFTWSLDVYDVIDFVYSANVCTIEPKQQGQATVTIHHPKAAYDQQIVVTVQEYSTFKFPNEYTSITAGKVDFKTMEVPNTKVSTHVEYSTDNANICLIEGTKNTAQIKGIAAGTTTVHARLIANSTGVEQANAEMMVYVKEAEVNACYITSSSTIYTVNKGKSQTLSALITGTGIVNSDQQNLKWTTSDTDVISIAGLNTNGTVTGNSIYITANNSGEAIITCSHEKSTSNLQFFILVPGSEKKAVSFNKTYITLVKGSSGSTLKATIENAESSNDYNELEWTVNNVGGNEVCRVMGSGQTVTIYPINVGEAEVMAQLPDSDSVAKCTVLVQAGKSFIFENTNVRVEPNGGTKKIKYIVSPANANLTWTMNQSDDFFTFNYGNPDENGVGYVTIEGIKEGSGNLYCVTDGGAKGNLSVKVAWNYEFTVSGSTTFSISPVETKEIEFTVSPEDSEIFVNSTDVDTLFNYEIKNNGNGKGSVIIKPILESANNVSINLIAKNPRNSNEVVGSKNITAKFMYSNLNVSVDYVGKTGNFSYWSDKNQSLTIGDGETVSLKFDIIEANANGNINKVEFAAKSNAVTKVKPELGTGTGTVYNIVEQGGDKKEDVYFIKKAWIPTFKGETVNNWKTDMNWYVTCCYHSQHNGNEYSYFLASNTYTNIWSYKCDTNKPDSWLRFWTDGEWSGTTIMFDRPAYDGKYCSRIRTYDYDNVEMSISEFESIPWFYSPGSRWSSFNNNDDSVAKCSINNEVQTSDKDSVYIKNEGSVASQNVDAEIRTTTNKTVVQSGLIGELKVTVTHNGKTETPISIPVYYEKRNCSMYQD